MIRIFKHYVPKSLLVLGTGEAAILFGSVYLGVLAPLADLNPTGKLIVGELWTKAFLYMGSMMLAMVCMGLYQRSLRDDIRGLLFRIGLALLVGLLFIAIAVTVFPSLSIGIRALTVSFIASATGIVLFRFVVHQFAGNTLFCRRVLLLGAGKMASQVEQLRRKVDRQDMKLVGFVHVPGEDDAVDAANVLHVQTTLLDLALAHKIDEIVVAIDERRSNFFVNQILDCKMHGIRVCELSTFFERQTGKLKLDVLDPSSMIFSDGFIHAVVKGYMHRAFDLGVSLLLLLVMWPIMIITAVLIWAASRFRGPVLYKQVRVGRDGRNFQVLKFRSMYVDAEKDGAQYASSDDSRVTWVGAVIRKLRIDELPQLVNVLRGEMSFVGPRPERPEFVAELAKKIPYYDLRHRVNPGITGWAQICYPYGSSEKDASEKLQFDLYYIKNYSLFLDLMILIQTAQVILWGKGAR